MTNCQDDVRMILWPPRTMTGAPGKLGRGTMLWKIHEECKWQQKPSFLPKSPKNITERLWKPIRLRRLRDAAESSHRHKWSNTHTDNLITPEKKAKRMTRLTKQRTGLGFYARTWLTELHHWYPDWYQGRVSRRPSWVLCDNKYAQSPSHSFSYHHPVPASSPFPTPTSTLHELPLVLHGARIQGMHLSSEYLLLLALIHICTQIILVAAYYTAHISSASRPGVQHPVHITTAWSQQKYQVVQHKVSYCTYCHWKIETM
jgi:hypothetical protein